METNGKIAANLFSTVIAITNNITVHDRNPTNMTVRDTNFKKQSKSDE